MAAISLLGISKRFGATQVLDQLSLDVDDGEFLTLLGPSGCGKTTLLRILAGLTAPSAGRILLDGRDVTDLAPRDRDMAMVFQSYALYPHLNVARNLGFGLSVRKRPAAEIDQAVRDVAGQLGLSALLRRKPRELSGGQRQRVAVGRAMVRDPKVFLMDEPLSNLDAQLRSATRLELSSLHRRLGTTFVYVTHDQVEAMTMGTKIAVLNGGRLEQLGTPAQIYDEPASSFVAGFMGAPPMNLMPATLRSRDGRVAVHADGIDVPLWGGQAEERAVLLGIRPEHLKLGPPDTVRPDAGLPSTGLSAAGLTDVGGPQLRGRVTAVENLGSEEVAFTEIGGRAVALRGPRPLGIHAGDHVTLTARPEHVYLFDATTTRRLVWVDDAPVAAPAVATAPLAERVPN